MSIGNSNNDQNDDDERTVFASLPDREDQTSSPSAVYPSDPDRTIISTLSPAHSAPSAQNTGLDNDDERTVFSTPPQESSSPPTTSTFAPQAAPGQAPFVERVETIRTDAGMTMSTEVPTPEPLRNLELGTVINNMYRVEQSLDQGGMGRVFRGVELGTGGPVAIKVILPEMADEQKAADMFRREAMTLRQLQHEAIVRYLAYIPPDERLGFHALVMGYIEGVKLNEHITTSQPLTLTEICTLFIRLSNGLSAAHREGVIHRDLSPDNVMLPDNDISKAVLIDFGISRSAAVKDVTLGNEFAGKLKYVSPEQLGAYDGNVDQRSDIYSMALLIIMTATGKPVPMGSSIVEAVKARDSIPDLSGAPAELQGLLYQMLQPDPKNRIASMSDVEDALKDIIGGRDPRGTMTGFPTMPTPNSQHSNSVSGLQAAPNVALTSTTTTNFGTGTTRTSFPATPQSNDGSHIPNTENTKTSPALKFLVTAALFALIGMGGVLSWSHISKPSIPQAVVPEESSDSLARLAGTRATFLAEYVPQTCAYATRRAKGPNAEMIEAFGSPATSFAGLRDSFQTTFGNAPTIIGQQVTDAQCAALDLARTFQGTASASTELTVDENTVSRQNIISGTLHGSLGRSDWLAIVAPNGLVFSLTKQLNDPIGNERGYVFRLPSASPGQYLLIAVSSEKPLVRTGAMQDGTKAKDIFKLLEVELKKAGQPSVDVGLINLTQ